MPNERMSDEMRTYAAEIDALCESLCKRLRERYCHASCDCLIEGIPGSTWGERICDQTGAKCAEFDRQAMFSRKRLCKALGIAETTVSNAVNGWFYLPQEIEVLLRLHEGAPELDGPLLTYIPDRQRRLGRAPPNRSLHRLPRGRPPLENPMTAADLDAFMRRWNTDEKMIARWLNDSIGGVMKGWQVTRWLTEKTTIPARQIKVFNNFNGNPLELPQYAGLHEATPPMLTSWCSRHELSPAGIEMLTGVSLSDSKNITAHRPLIGIRFLNAQVWFRIARARNSGNAPASYPATIGLARRLCDYYRAVVYANLGGGYDRIEARDALWEAIEREVAPVKRDLGWAHNYYDRDHPKAEPFPEGSV